MTRGMRTAERRVPLSSSVASTSSAPGREAGRVCYRCERSGHLASQCYARVHVSGAPLDEEDSEEEGDEEESEEEDSEEDY